MIYSFSARQSGGVSVGVAQVGESFERPVTVARGVLRETRYEALSGHREFVVLLVSQGADGLSAPQRDLTSDRFKVVATSWQKLASLSSNPWQREAAAHLEWRQLRSHAL